MRIKGTFSKGILIALVFIFLPVSAISAQKVSTGSTCKIYKQKVTFQSKIYTCTKSGKKLVWSKGVVVVKPTPTPTPTAIGDPLGAVGGSPTPTPTPTTTLTPTPTLSITELLWSRGVNGVFPIENEKYAIPTALASTWQDAYVNRDGIPYQAWSVISKNIATSPSKLGNVEIFVGPNTIPNFADFKLRMELVSKALPRARNVSKLKLFAFNYKDADWADATFKQLYANETALFWRWHTNAVSEICSKAREVCFQQAFVDSNLDGVMFIGMTDKGSREQLNQTFSEYSRAFLGQVIGHEYLHTIQRVILGDRWYQQAYTPPSWFNEGMAVFMDNAASNHASFDAYMRYRAVDSKLLHPECPYEYCVKVTKAQVEDFLSVYNYSTNWNTFPAAMKYEMSARLMEVIVALKGPDSLTALYEYMATEKSFGQAFEYVYGISYEQAKPILASIVVDQITAGK